jgi:translation initiation factor 5B
VPIDTGKTLLLDQIRKSSVQAHEAGGITQHIGASFFPLDVLIDTFGQLLSRFRDGVEIPGLLVIDTPGHEAFANLRQRGGGVADIAILVMDVLRGFETQTYEVIEILRARKTPFLVAANKIDRLPGWISRPNESFSISYKEQDSYVRQNLDEHLYKIMGDFSRIGFQVDRFDNVSNFTETIAIVPVSAKTGEGLSELLAVLVGITQQYMKDRLQVTDGPAKGTVLEVKEETGLGITLNAIIAIIYDGILRKNDLIVVGGKKTPIRTRVRAILLPKPLDEIRDPRNRFSSVDSVSAAAGIKLVAPNLEDALAGSPIYSIPSSDLMNEYMTSVSEEVEELRIATDVNGVILKTDTLGSLEAIATSLKQNGIPIRLADVGDVSKRDVVEATVVKQNERFYGVILAFNVRILSDASEEAKDRGILIFNHNIIYHLLDSYTQWAKNEKEKFLKNEFERLIKPGKILILPDYVFRKAKPAVVGVEVLAGRIRPRQHLVKENGTDIGEIMQIQDRGDSISEAKEQMQVAVSFEKLTVGRQINEKDILYVKIPETHVKILLTRFHDHLTSNEIKILDELVQLMRRKSAFWAT